MPKANRKKLSKEELKEENARIKKEMSQTTEAQSEQRIVDLLSKENWIVYILTALLPPVGIWYIWKKKDKHKLNLASMMVWTLVGIIITVEWIVQIVNWVK